MRTTLAVLAVLGVVACESKAPSGEAWQDRSDGKPPELPVVRTAAAPKIDGVLSDAAWQGAKSTGPFVDPGSGKPRSSSKVNATARLAYDENALYAAVRVFDAEPSTPFARSDIDPHVWSKASGIELMLQPGRFEDNRDYFELQIDVGGAVWDTRFDDYNQPISGAPPKQRFGHQQWQSQVERATAKSSEGYVIELAMPWSALGEVRTSLPPSAGDVWRANLYSFRDGQADALAWSPILGQGNFHKASRFGRLSFQ